MKRIHTKVVLDISTGNVIEDEYYLYSGPVVACKTKTESSSKVPPPSEEELRLMRIAGDIGQQQHSAILAQSGMQNLMYGMAPDLINQIASSLGLNLGTGSAGSFANPNAPSISQPALNGSELAELKELTGIRDRSGKNWEGNNKLVNVRYPEITSQQTARLNELLSRQQAGPSTIGFGAGSSSGSAVAPAAGGGTLGMAQPTGAGDPIVDELVQGDLNRIRGGGEASDYQRQYLQQIADESIGLANSDIDAGLSDSLMQVRDILAPSRGLRTTDSPILDRGQLLAKEALRLKSQFAGSARAAQAKGMLEYPLAQGQVVGEWSSALKDFQDRLKQSATQNRLALLSGIQGGGLALAGVGDAAGAASNMQRERMANATTTQTTSDPWGAVKSIGQGIGAVWPSSKALKKSYGRVSGKMILIQLAKLPIDAWSYKGETEPHVGTYAEDFNEAFGLGDGKTISAMDAVGVLMAAVKELAKQVEELKHARA